MGYSTVFTGKLEFVNEPTAKQLHFINSMCGEDCRDHPEWEASSLYYIDLELSDDFSGIEWNGAEKTYHMVDIVNFVIKETKKKWPDFGLKGVLTAQGEDIEDRWQLVIDYDGLAKKVDLVVTGKIITCPICCGKFELDQGESK